MTSIRYSESVDVESWLTLAQRVWPGDYPRERAREALRHTTNCGAWDGRRLVGSVRLLTDGYFFATIPEILVDPEYQRRGIGRELMNRILAQAPRHKAFFGAQPQSVTFFDRIGCDRTLTGFVAQWPLQVRSEPRAI